MAENKIRVGDIEKVSGEVTIAGRDVYRGYTAEQVSALLNQIQSRFQLKPFDGRCPYKGLDVFKEEDAEFFFGREQQVNELLGRLKESRVVFITGPSGSGKSSLVRAGLIPALKQGSLQSMHSERWLYQTMQPGRDPISELARVTSGFAGTLNAGEDIRSRGANDVTILAKWCDIALREGREKRAVLFVDQFEEIFTQVSREDERLTFLRLLTHAATVENGRVILLFAMRSDFVSNCAAYPVLNEVLNRRFAFAQIGAMQPDELVSAIAQPALCVGLQMDPDLISQIIHDMEGEPGELPLMQFALKDLFDAEQAKGRLIALKVEDYLQRGGIHKALERHADAAFSKLTKTEQVLTENLFKGLVEVGRDAPDTRRIAHFEEFTSPEVSFYAFESVVRRLADARLISTDQDKATGRTITLAHEKLIEAWPWLRQLINDNRQFIQLQNHIIEDALEWEKHGKDKSYLYAGARLESIQKMIETFQIRSEIAKAFLRASEDAYRRKRLQRFFIAGLMLVMIGVTYFAVIDPWFRDKLDLQPVDMGGAGITALQKLSDGTVYAGLFNNRLKDGGPCLARLAFGSSSWEKFGPSCPKSVNTLWINPSDPNQVYVSKSDETGLYRSLDRGQKWERVGTGDDLPMTDISSLAGTPEGLLFIGDLKSAMGVYQSSNQGNTWAPLDGSPRTTIFTLMWVPQQGLLVGGNGGLWLWKPNGEWEQLIALDVAKKDQRILSITVLPDEAFTVLAGGQDGIYFWREGDPPQSTPQNTVVKTVWSLVFISKPEPYVVAQTLANSEIWRMTPEGKAPVLLSTAGSDGFALIAQNEDPLHLWVGTVEGLFSGTIQNKAAELIGSNK